MRVLPMLYMIGNPKKKSNPLEESFMISYIYHNNYMENLWSNPSTPNKEGAIKALAYLKITGPTR